MEASNSPILWFPRTFCLVKSKLKIKQNSYLRLDHTAYYSNRLHVILLN
jgi:hypothetical protein